MLHFPDIDIEAGDLVLERDTGLVWRRVDESLEPCGFIGDEDNCPPGMEPEWELLARWWRESGEYGEACRAAAETAWLGWFAGAAFRG